MRTVLFWSGLFSAAMAIQTLTAPAAYSEPEPRGRQEKGRREKPPEGAPKEHGALGPEFVDRLTEHLKLSEEQQKKVKSIVDQARPEIEKVEAEMKAVGARLKAAMRKTSEAIRETLDLDQKEKFDEMAMHMKQNMQQRRRGGMGGGMRGGGGGERRERTIIEMREGPGGRFEAPEQEQRQGPPHDDDDGDKED